MGKIVGITGEYFKQCTVFKYKLQKKSFKWIKVNLLSYLKMKYRNF